MSVFSGVISTKNVAHTQGTARSILSHVVAPHHDTIKHHKDCDTEFAYRCSSKQTGFHFDDNLIVVADCRLDNSQQLMLDLNAPSAEVNYGALLATGYEKWGRGIVQHLLGDFAFAIWDKNKKSLFCARDRFGRTPFAYFLGPHGLVFCSDYWSIAASLANFPSINEAWVVEYINRTVTNEVSTPFEGVNRLPPGCAMAWRNGEVKIDQYWRLSNIGPTDNEFSASKLYDAIKSSTRNRLVDPKTMTMLSGGLDSSSVAILARDFRERNETGTLTSVSVVFDDYPEGSERPFIEAVLEEGGFDHHFVNVRDYDPISEIRRLVRIHGGPTFALSAPVLDHALAKIESLGFTTALDGHGGDEVISSFGTMRLFELANDQKWLTLFFELIRASRHSELRVMKNFMALYSSRGKSFFAKIVRKIYLATRALGKVDPAPVLLSEKWSKHPSVAKCKRLQRRANPSVFSNEREFHESILASPRNSYAFEMLSRQYRSRGIRPEFPFWELSVVDLSLRAPSNEKLKKGVPRSLIRSAMGSRLPGNVANRTSKYDFSDCLVRSLQGSLDELHKIAANQSLRVFDYVDRKVFESSLADLSAGQRNARVQAAQNAWIVLNLHFWFEMMIDRQNKIEQGSNR